MYNRAKYERLKKVPTYHAKLKVYRNTAQTKRRDLFNKLFKDGKPCADCGGMFPPCCMDFDHRDPSTKVMNISAMIGRGRSTDAIMEEAAKCDLVCANCHRIRSYNSRAWMPSRWADNTDNHAWRYHECSDSCPQFPKN